MGQATTAADHTPHTIVINRVFLIFSALLFSVMCFQATPVLIHIYDIEKYPLILNFGAQIQIDTELDYLIYLIDYNK